MTASSPAPEARPWRSVLYVPGANRKALEKAAGLPADAFILDLEDAVAPEAKVEARETIGAMFGQVDWRRRPVILRINALASPWGRDDIAFAVAIGVKAVLLPKVNDEADLHAARDRLQRAGAGGDVALWAMVETPLALLNLAAIARVARTHGGLAGLVAGTNDLVKDMRLGLRSDLPADRRFGLWPALSGIVAAARAYDLVALDGVFNDIADETGLVAECREGRALGFHGKTLIHPGQIAPASQVFAPEPAAIARAEAIVAAFEAPENAGKGVLKIDGAMTELLHYHAARRILAEARAIDARSAG